MQPSGTLSSIEDQPHNIASTAVVESNVLLPHGLLIEDDVHIEKGVIFCDAPGKSVTVRRGARIGAGAIIGAGLELGAGSQVMQGSVVFQSVPANAVVRGNPAHIVGYTSSSSSAFGIQKSSSAVFSGAVQNSSTEVELGVGGAKLYRLPHISDLRGSLSVGEFDNRLPFVPKRYFIVFDVPSEELRGEHAHRVCHQFLVCVHGVCTALVDNGSDRREIILDRPSIGLYMPPMLWGTQYAYSRDAVLLVFASHHYDNSDYIRSYDEFSSEIARYIK
jgi:UDP-2-acetamido-3-amino-2,3-dideoxy-glucuronate N-acetyltransferase